MSFANNWSPYESAPFLANTTQRYVAHCSVGASTIRRMGCDINGIRKSLSIVNLDDLKVDGVAVVLESATSSILAPCNGKFGPARKCLNIFLKNCYHNRFLSAQFFDDNVIANLELPLDARTMKGVRDAGRKTLPRKRVIELTPDDNAEYQQIALEIARQRKVARVDLDVLWWLPE